MSLQSKACRDMSTASLGATAVGSGDKTDDQQMAGCRDFVITAVYCLVFHIF